MKPTKNKYFCNDCGRSKMRFESEINANTFLKFNADEIEEENGKRPIRSYHCIACDCWHVTSKKDAKNLKSRTEMVLEMYQEDKERKIKNFIDPEILKYKNSQTKEELIKETKVNRDELHTFLYDIKVNVEMIEFLLKIGKIDEGIQILTNTYSIIHDFDNMVSGLEKKYRTVMSMEEVASVFDQRKKRKQELEVALDKLRSETEKK